MSGNKFMNCISEQIDYQTATIDVITMIRWVRLAIIQHCTGQFYLFDGEKVGWWTIQNTSHFSENKAIAIYIITVCFGQNCKTVYHHALETHLQMDHLNLVWAKLSEHWFIIMRIRNTAQRPWNSWNVGFPWWVFSVVAPNVCSAGPAHQGWRDGNRTGSTTTPVAAEHNGNLRPQVLVRKCENVWNIRISTASTTSRSRKMNIL